MMLSLKHSLTRRRAVPIAVTTAISILGLQGCGMKQIYDDQATIARTARTIANSTPQSSSIITTHAGAWLTGERIPASKSQPDIYDKHVVYNATSPSLSAIATWIVQQIGVRAEVDASATQTSAGTPSAPAAIPLNVPGRTPTLPAGLATALSPFGGTSAPADTGMPLRYSGTFRGFLDLVGARFGVWSQYRDGTVRFLRTETRTFTLPTLADQSVMSGQITTGDNSSGGSSNGSSMGSSGSGTLNTLGSASGLSGNGGSGTGGQTMGLSVQSSPLATIQSTAQALAGTGSTVVVDQNLGVLSVTGSPPQCDRVEEWVRKLTAMYGKQVAIDVHVYEVRLTHEENYGLNLALAYKSHSGHTGLSSVSASTPTVLGSSTPMTFGAQILSGPLAGSSATIQALSSLGNVSEVVSRSGVTQNGKLLALQAARSQGYVQSTSTTLAASVGSSTAIQTGTIVPGFTSAFMPKVIDGRILLDFDMTLSDLLSLQTFTSGTGSGQSSVQLPSLQMARFEQSVSLKPGETLVLTGMRQVTATTTNNGVGSPYMPLLGGGVDAQKGDTVLAVVISARLL